MTERDGGPKSQLVRYAYGYSDRKPRIFREIILPFLMLIGICLLLGAI